MTDRWEVHDRWMRQGRLYPAAWSWSEASIQFVVVVVAAAAAAVAAAVAGH
jgi:hypothetical protein